MTMNDDTGMNVHRGLDLGPFVAHINESCGLLFEGTRKIALAGGIETRMAECGLTDVARYFRLMSADRAEMHRLVSHITINETYFYRERRHYDLLASALYPALRETTSGRVRIISAGCSTGEEAYSVVIALVERFGRKVLRSIEVQGVDIDEAILGSAILGIYGRSSFRGFDPGLKSRYFTEQPDGTFRIADFVRDAVTFTQLNLNEPIYPKVMHGAGIIMYRNVSIYFRPDVQRDIFIRLSNLLVDQGYLIVGSTETMLHNIGLLALKEIDGTFLYQKGLRLGIEDRRMRDAPRGSKRPVARPTARHAQETDGPGVFMPGISWGGHRETARTRSMDFQEALDLARQGLHQEALSATEAYLGESPDQLSAKVLRGALLVNLGRLKDAFAYCRDLTVIEPECLEAHILLGIVARANYDKDSAIKSFKQALSVEPLSWLPRYYMAELYHCGGDIERACREYAAVIEMLDGKDMQEEGLKYFPLSFKGDQILRLCRINVGKLCCGEATNGPS